MASSLQINESYSEVVLESLSRRLHTFYECMELCISKNMYIYIHTYCAYWRSFSIYYCSLFTLILQSFKGMQEVRPHYLYLNIRFFQKYDLGSQILEDCMLKKCKTLVPTALCLLYFVPCFLAFVLNTAKFFRKLD